MSISMRRGASNEHHNIFFVEKSEKSVFWLKPRLILSHVKEKIHGKF